jgi:hypothetical protein
MGQGVREEDALLGDMGGDGEYLGKRGVRSAEELLGATWSGIEAGT